MSIMLAAADLGIGSAHAGVHDQELARRLLGVPEDRFCAVLITLGTPADRPLTPIAAARPAPIHRGGAPRLLVVAAPGPAGRCRPGRRRSASTPRGRTQPPDP